VNTKTDSDNDTFLDREELVNLFNPSGTGKLKDTDFVEAYVNSTYGFSVLYPEDFLAQPTGLNDRETILSYTPTGEFFQVRVIENPTGETARDWYLDSDPSVSPGELTDITVGSFKGVESPDGFTVVLADSQRLYTLHYDFGGQLEISFRSTFQMLVASFTRVAVTPATNTNTGNTNTGNTNTGNTNTNTNTNTGNTNTLSNS
jgi:hypothetical protein